MARRLGFGGIFVVLIAVWLSAAQAPGSGAQRPGGPPPPASELPPPVTDPTGDAFYTAIRTDNAAALGELLKTANVNYVERRGGATPLMHAAAFGSLDTLRLLLDAGANVNAKSYAGATALMWAASQPDKVRLLVERGADVNLASEAGRTALQLAAMSGGSSDTVRLLLSKGANAKAVDKLGQTVLQAAVQGTDFGSITQIVEAGVDVNAADMAAGFSPLILASALGNTNAARLLLGKGARVNTVSSPPGVTVKNGTIALGRFTPLLIASTYGPADLVKLLLDAGADVNARDARGMTPLMMAVAADHGDPEIVRMLIAKGADLNAKSDAGESALDWARKGGATTRTKLLEGAGAQAFAAPAAAVRPAATASAATPAAIRAAVTRGVTITERVSAGFLASGGCASCHAQNITDVAVAEAKRAGVRVDEAAANERARGSSAQFGSLASRFLEREDGPAAVILMYALLALDAHTHPADRATDALVFNLAAQQASNGSWPTFGNSRAPTADGQIPETALGIKAFAAYGMPGRGAEMKGRVSRAAAWLRAAPVTTADDRAFRTLGLKWSGAPADELRRAAQAALATQKPDGGFAQHDEMQSDAYATSITLYAALQAGVPTTDARVQKAIAYLVSTQHEDGSWFVRSRAPKFQPYFDSGFPYEHDQWISSMATGWGTAALASVLRNEPGRAAQ